MSEYYPVCSLLVISFLCADGVRQGMSIGIGFLMDMSASKEYMKYVQRCSDTVDGRDPAPPGMCKTL